MITFYRVAGARGEAARGRPVAEEGRRDTGGERPAESAAAGPGVRRVRGGGRSFFLTTRPRPDETRNRKTKTKHDIVHETTSHTSSLGSKIPPRLVLQECSSTSTRVPPLIQTGNSHSDTSSKTGYLSPPRFVWRPLLTPPVKPRVTLSLRQGRLRAACCPRQEERKG